MDSFNLYYIKNHYPGLEGEPGNPATFTTALGLIIWSAISEWTSHEMEFVWPCANQVSYWFVVTDSHISPEHYSCLLPTGVYNMIQHCIWHTSAVLPVIDNHGWLIIQTLDWNNKQVKTKNIYIQFVLLYYIVYILINYFYTTY